MGVGGGLQSLKRDVEPLPMILLHSLFKQTHIVHCFHFRLFYGYTNKARNLGLIFFFFSLSSLFLFFFHKVTAEATTKHCAMKPLTAAALQPVLADTNSLALSFWPPTTCPSFFSTSNPLLYLVHQRTYNCLA